MIYGRDLENYRFENGSSPFSDEDRQHINHYSIQFYKSHIGIIYEDGHTVASVPGGHTEQALDTACRLVCLANYALERMAKND